MTVVVAENLAPASPTPSAPGVSQPAYQQADYIPYQTYAYDDTYGGSRRTEPANEIQQKDDVSVTTCFILNSYCLYVYN